MCLNSVTNSNANSKIIHSGYKEFYGTDKKPEFATYPMKAGKQVPLDKWIRAEGIKEIANDGKEYPALFHIYEETDPKSFRKRTRVFFRGLKVVGLQGSEKCYIAEEMYVPSDPNGWPPIEKSATSTPPKESPVKVIIEKLTSTLEDLKKIAGNA